MLTQNLISFHLRLWMSLSPGNKPNRQSCLMLVAQRRKSLRPTKCSRPLRIREQMKYIWTKWNGEWIRSMNNKVVSPPPPSEMLPHPQHNNQLSTSSNRIEWCINTKSTEKKHKEQLSPWVGTHDINKSTQNQHQLPNKKGIDPSHHGLKRKASPKLKGEWKSWGITKSCINLKLTKYIHWTHRKSARSKRHFLVTFSHLNQSEWYLRTVRMSWLRACERVDPTVLMSST